MTPTACVLIPAISDKLNLFNYRDLPGDFWMNDSDNLDKPKGALM